MRKIFISDAHLRSENDDNYRILLDFLGKLPGTTDTLFILGDLFEFWIGYASVPFQHYRTILVQLQRLCESGVEIVYFEGNHDFHMGPFFEVTLKARVFSSPAVFELDGKRIYLCHGDQINSDDYGYRLLRYILHNRLTAALIPLVPPGLASFIAERMGRASRKNHGRRRIKWDYPSIMRKFASDRFREGCDAVIAGHFHLPLFEETGNERKHTLISLGDWIAHFTYGELDNGNFSLKRYKP